MDSVIRTMTGPELIGLVAVTLGILGVACIAVAAIVVPVGTWARRVEARAQLARDLASSGFTAADIERVLRAAGGEPPVDGHG